jgi:hypothetical protein
VVAVFTDGTLRQAAQTVPNGGWSGWSNLGGVALRGNVALARNADGRLEAFAVGGDGVVYNIWQQVPNGQGGWSPWSSLADKALPSIANIATISSNEGRIYVFLMGADGAVSYRAQASPNGPWANTVHLGGQGLLWPCVVGMNPDGRLEIFVTGGDHAVHNRWQVDRSQPEAWSDWVNLGARDLHAGISAGADHTGELVLYVVGGDGALYRGPR